VRAAARDVTARPDPGSIVTSEHRPPVASLSRRRFFSLWRGAEHLEKPHYSLSLFISGLFARTRYPITAHCSPAEALLSICAVETPKNYSSKRELDISARAVCAFYIH